MRDDDHFNELLRRIRALESMVGGGGIAGVRVEDESTSIVALANALNFMGAGVTVTNGGSNEATITIPGGLTGPAGPPGATGPIGPQGPPGTSGGGAAIEVGPDAPPTPASGMLWYDTDNGRLYIWFDLVWVEVTGGEPDWGPPAVVEVEAYVHSQGVAASTWVITHNLGWNPNVVVVDSGGDTAEGDIAFTSLNTLTITFSAAFSGTAYLS